MGKYIGRDIAYGALEKQVLRILETNLQEYDLTYPVADPASLLVIANGAVLEPNSDDGHGYSIVGNGKKIRFDTAPDPEIESKIHIIYLARQLITPAVAERSPLLFQTVGDNSTRQFNITTPSVTLTEHGVLVFLNKSLLRYNDDFTITNNTIVLSNTVATPTSNDKIDIYLFGSERSTFDLILDNSIITDKLSNESVTPSKIFINFKPFPQTAPFLVGTDVMTTNFVSVKYAEYQKLGKLIKVRASFDITLTGTPDNKIGFSLPVLNDGNTNILGTAVMSSSDSMETGIIRWSGLGNFNLYRQFGVNFITTEMTTKTYTVDLNFEYTTT